MSKIAPCKDCPDDVRHVGCHATCNGYVAWKSEHEKEKEQIRKDKQQDTICDDFKMKSIYKSRRKAR